MSQSDVTVPVGQPESMQLRLQGLASMADLCSRLALTSGQIYWLISIKQLPAWLVDGLWKFDLDEVDTWTVEHGGRAEVAKACAEAANDSQAVHKL